jgi:hypothetical protein
MHGDANKLSFQLVRVYYMYLYIHVYCLVSIIRRGDINPNRVKIESADNWDSLLLIYSIIDFLGKMYQLRIIQFRGKSSHG